MMFVRSCNVCNQARGQPLKNTNDADKIDFTKNNYLNSPHISNANKTLLHEAAKYGSVENIKCLIEAGFDVNAQDYLGKTAIMYAIENESIGCLQVIKILYEAKADIHIIDKRGKSAVNLVLNDTDYRSEHIQKFFLEVIYCECMNQSEMTAKKLISLRYPLHQAILLGNPNVVEYMILNGIPVDSCHPDNKLTALAKAIQRMDLEIVKVLIRYGADVDFDDICGFLPIFHYGSNLRNDIQNPEIIPILLNKSTVLKDFHQRNAIFQLQSAFMYGNKKVIQMLLEHHSDILNIKDIEHQTPVHYLSANGHSDITELLQDQKIDVNVKDLGGRTPIYVAAKFPHSHINTIRFLLQNGADVNVRTVFGHLDVPLFALCGRPFIEKEIYLEIVDMFLEYNLNVQYVGSSQITVFDIIIDANLLFMAEPLIAHLAILSESGKSIVECVHKRIMSHETLKKCFDACKAEITNMKNNIINNKVTLYSIFVNQMSDEDILKSCKFSPNSLSRFEKLKINFPLSNHYYNLTQKRISSIISKLELLQKAASVICKLSKLKIGANHLVMIEIISYFDIQDLNILMNV